MATTVEIGCAVFGCGDIFAMVVARHTRVHKLRDAIFEKHPYDRDRGADATMMRLFVAKDAATGAWLQDNVALDTLLAASPDVVRAKRFVRMRLLRPLDDDVNFGTNFSVGDGRVHVLIQLPRLPALDRRAYDIHSTLLFHVLVDEGQSSLVCRSTPAREAEEKEHVFQHQLMVVYKCAVSTTSTNTKTTTTASITTTESDTLRCMLLDTALPSDLVTAVHVFPRRNAFLVEQEFLELEDVDDVTNGLLLATPLAHAFENFQLCFVEDDHERSETWRLKLTDPTLRPQRLVDYVDHRTGAKAIGDDRFLAMPVALETTFGALEGRALSFRSGVRPVWQCMNLHARLARAKATRDQWIESRAGTQLADVWTEALTIAEQTERLYARDAARE